MKTLNCIVAILAFAFVSFGSVVPVDAQTPGRWFGRERVDDFSGETEYRAFSFQASVGTGSRMRLQFDCDGSSTSVLLRLNDGIARDGSFQYRVDDSDVRNASWNDGNEFVSIAGVGAVAFIREISGGRELRVRIPRFRDSSVDATFNLEGMATHVDEIRRLCDW